MEKLIYVGPNLRNNALIQFTVFAGGMPKHIDKELAAVPELAKLFVPIAKLEPAQVQIAAYGTPLAKYYQKVKEAL